MVNGDYWQVYCDTNRGDTLAEAGFHAAEQPIVVRTSGNGVSAASHAAAVPGRSTL